MSRQIDKVRSRINEVFRDKLKEAFKAEFGRELEAEWNFMAMALVSRPADGKKFTKKQHAFVKAYSDGYGEAMIQVRV